MFGSSSQQRELKVVLTADSAALERAMASSSRSTTTTDSAFRRTAGTALKLGAALAGAAAGYLSIAKARESVTVTTDLAKATAGLNRNLGLSETVASRWATVAKARDIDSKSLTMSLTTLSRQYVAAADGSDTALESFEALGITQQDIIDSGGDFNKFLLMVADGFGEAEGGAKRQAAAQALLGRGYQTLLPMFASGSEGLREQLHWADEYGTVLKGKTLDGTMAYVSAQRESKAAMMGLEVTVGKLLIPTLTDANLEFQKLARIVGDPKLTDQEKFEKASKMIGEWAEKGVDAFEEVLPEIAEHAGEAAPKIAGALVNGFIDAPIMGKLALAAWLLKAFGGGAVARGIGMQLGQRIAGPMSTTVAQRGLMGVPWSQSGSKAGGLFGSSFSRVVAGGAMLVGIEQALTTRGGILDTLEGRGSVDFGEVILGGEDLGKLGLAVRKAVDSRDLDDLNELDNLLGALVKSARKSGEVIPPEVKQWVDAIDRAKRKVSGDLSGAIISFRHFTSEAVETSKKVDKAFKNVSGSSREAMSDTAHAVARGAKSIDDFGEKAPRDLDRVGDASKKQGSRVADNSASMVNAVLDGYGILGKETKDALKAFGVNKAAYTAGSAVAKGADGVQFKQQGGVIVPGTGTGDQFPLMMPAGGFVLNRDAANAFFGLQLGGMVPTMLEPGELAFPMATPVLQLMNDLVPRRLQKGGAAGGGLDFALGPYDIPPIQYAADHAGDNSHVHITGTTTPWVVAIGKQLQQMGMMVGEHPAFGGVQGTHSATGGHYDALAIDVNTASDETRSEVSQIARLIGGSGGGGTLAERIAQIILKGPKGPLREMGQGALDMTHKAANAYIAKMIPRVVEGSGGPLLSGDGDVERVFAQVTRKLSKSKTATLALGMAGYAESEMQDLPGGDRDSAGSLQVRASVHPGVNPHDEGQVASIFYNSGFTGRGGANALAGSGLAAHLVAQGVQGSYDPSGSNYLARKGQAQAWMGRYGLQRGGAVAGGGKGKRPPTLNIKPPLGFNPKPPPWWEYQEPPAPLPAPPAITVENQLTALDIALTKAEETETISDDAFVLMTRAQILAGERERVEGDLENLTLSDAERERIQKEAQARVAGLQKKLAKGGLTDKERAQIERERVKIEQGLAAKALGEKRSDLLGQLDSLTGELAGTRDALDSLTEQESEANRLARELAEAQTRAAEEMKALRASIDAQNRILASEAMVGRTELLRAMADLLSGEIGGRIAQNEYVPGYGSVASA